MKEKYDERAQNRTVLPGMHVLVSQVAGLAGVDRSTRWLRGICIGRSGSKLTVRLNDGRVIQRHLDQVVPDTSCATRRAGSSEGLDDESAAPVTPPAAVVPTVARPVSPAPSVVAGRTASDGEPASGPAGSPAPRGSTPAKEATSLPEQQLKNPVVEVPAGEAPSAEPECPSPRYNLRPRKARPTYV